MRKRILRKPTQFGRELGGLTKINLSAEWQTSHRAADKGKASSDKLCSNPGGGVLEYWSVGRACNGSHGDAGESTGLCPNCTPRTRG